MHVTKGVKQKGTLMGTVLDIIVEKYQVFHVIKC